VESIMLSQGAGRLWRMSETGEPTSEAAAAKAEVAARYPATHQLLEENRDDSRLRGTALRKKRPRQSARTRTGMI
jgi:hypothetical protein